MIISISDELKDLKKYISTLGYDIHNISERVISDIYIYSEKENALANIMHNLAGQDDGSLLINSDNLSYSEIERVLKSKVYSSLFYHDDDKTIMPFNQYTDRNFV